MTKVSHRTTQAPRPGASEQPATDTSTATANSGSAGDVQNTRALERIGIDSNDAMADTPAKIDDGRPSGPDPRAGQGTSQLGLLAQNKSSKKGKIEKLVDKAQDKLGDLARKEVQKEHHVDTSFDLIDGLEGQVRLKKQVFLPGSKTVKNNALMKATTQRMQDQGDSVAWAKVDGEFELKSSFSLGVGEASMGFPAGAKLGYSLTKPLAYKKDGETKAKDTAMQVLRDQTVDLPVSASKARALPAGSEFQLRGNVHYGLTGAQDQHRANVGRSHPATVDVTRLEGDEVKVTLRRATKTQAGVSTEIGLDEVRILPSISGSLGEGRTETFTLDLSKPQAQKAYGALMRGDGQRARDLVAQDDSGVHRSSAQDWTTAKIKVGLKPMLANGFSTGLSVYQEKIGELDPRFAKNATRKQITADAAARGDKVTWHGSGGAIEPTFSTAAEFGGVGVGFASDGLVEYHAVSPRGDGHDGITSPADLPLNASGARALATGSEVVLRGKGKVRLWTDHSKGSTVGLGRVSIGAKAGVKTKIMASEEMALKITKLGDNKVRVILAERGERGADLTAGVEAGLIIDRDRLPGGSALQGLVDDKLADKLKDKVGGKLEDIFNARAEMGITQSSSERDVLAYDIDLSTPQGRDAYDKLLRLDTTHAAQAASVEGSGVEFVGSLTDDSSTRTTHAEVKLLGATIYEGKSERRNRVAMLVNGDNTTRIDEQEFKKSTKGLWWKGGVEWEAVRVDNQTTGQQQRFLHLNLNNKELLNNDELNASINLADMMDARVVKKDIKNDDPGWFDRNINPMTHGKATTRADIYFTDGVRAQIAKVDHEQAMSAFAEAQQKINGEDRPPAWADPDLKVRQEARSILEDYDGFSDGEDDPSSDYLMATGCDLDSDYRSYEAAKDFGTFVNSARQGEDAFLKGFADLGEKRGFRFHSTIGALDLLSGEEVVLLNKLEIDGKDVHFQVASEGALTHPDARVRAAFIDE